MALQRVLRGNRRSGPKRPARPPAGHGVGLRRRAADDTEVLAVALDHCRQVVRRRVVDQLLVTEVEDQPDAAPRRLLRQRRERVFGHQRTGRVARRVEDDALRARRDGVEEELCGQREAVVCPRPHHHRLGIGQLHLLDQRRPAGRVRDDLVAGIEQRQRRVVERLLAAGAGDDFVLAILNAVVGLVARDDGALQLEGAAHRRVLREVAVDGGVRRLADRGRRREVGFTGTEVPHLHAVAAQAIDSRRHLHRR